MTRAECFAEFDAHAVKVDGGIAFRTDDAVERLWAKWVTDGRKGGVRIGIDSAANGAELLWIMPVEVVDVSSLF